MPPLGQNPPGTRSLLGRKPKPLKPVVLAGLPFGPVSHPFPCAHMLHAGLAGSGTHGAHSRPRAFALAVPSARTMLPSSHTSWSQYLCHLQEHCGPAVLCPCFPVPLASCPAQCYGFKGDFLFAVSLYVNLRRTGSCSVYLRLPPAPQCQEPCLVPSGGSINRGERRQVGRLMWAYVPIY